MSAKEMNQMSLSELNQKLQNEFATRFKLRMQQGNSQLSKTDQLMKNRRAIARLKTLMHQKRAEELKA
tara:strand:+ start:87 stop:290 length:204 start_codon:yes stop_codon:yes gene_type:complete